MQEMGMLDTGSSAGFLGVFFDAYSMLEKLEEAVNKLKIKVLMAAEPPVKEVTEPMDN